MQRTVIASLGTSTIVAGSAVPFTVRSGDFKGGTKPTLTVTNLAGAETATLLKNGQPVKDGVLDYAAGACSVSLESAGEYSIYKDATVGDPAVIIENSD